MKKSKFFFAGVVLITAPLFGKIIRVPDDQPTIQSGIVQSETGDTVLVSSGTYYKNLNLMGKHSVVASHFALTRDPNDVLSTIIDGSRPSYPDSSSCVFVVSGEKRTTVLEGFTLTGGTGAKWSDKHTGGFFREGGGILTESSSPINNTRND